MQGWFKHGSILDGNILCCWVSSQWQSTLKLVKIEKGTSISLTSDGVKMAEAILKEGAILGEERQFLSEVAPRMTDTLMKRVWRLEDLL